MLHEEPKEFPKLPQLSVIMIQTTYSHLVTSISMFITVLFLLCLFLKRKTVIPAVKIVLCNVSYKVSPGKLSKED